MLVFIIRREDELVGAEFTALPDALVQIQNSSGLRFEMRVTRKNPAAVLPRTDGVLVQPSPDGGVTEGCRQAASADMCAEFRHAPARKGHTAAIGKFAGDSFNLHDQFWGGGNPGSAGAMAVFQTCQAFFEESFPPAADDLTSSAQAIGNLIVRQTLLSEEDHLGASDSKIR
jgi:hypothetical protein